LTLLPIVRIEMVTTEQSRNSPFGDVAGYHSETMSSLAFTSGTQGSGGLEVSFRYTDVVPTG
jgi:hypothetical protein